MPEINHPILSKRKIIKSVVAGLIIGTVLLVCAILPAEYGIDPTGAGKLFGFNRLYVPENAVAGETGEGKPVVAGAYPLLKLERVGSAPEVKRPVEADAPPPAQQYESREDSVQVNVPAGKGLEYKIYMQKYGSVKYEWSTDKDHVYIDFHGEVNQENPPADVYFESYTKAYSNNMAGTLLAPFEGKHGWYFKNNGKEDVVVTIRLKGQYVL